MLRNGTASQIIAHKQHGVKNLPRFYEIRERLGGIGGLQQTEIGDPEAEGPRFGPYPLLIGCRQLCYTMEFPSIMMVSRMVLVALLRKWGRSGGWWAVVVDVTVVVR